MHPQTSQTRKIPLPLSPELEQLRSRLEQGLLRLARLSAAEFAHAPCDEIDAPAATAIPSASPDWERGTFPSREGNCRVAVCRLTGNDHSFTAQEIEWRLHATSLKGRVQELSLDGARFQLPEPIPAAENVVLRLFCPRRDRFFDQTAVVLNSQPNTTGGFQVACRFKNRLSFEQVSDLSRFWNHSRWM